MNALYCLRIGSSKSCSTVKRGGADPVVGRAQASVGQRLNPPPVVDRNAKTSSRPMNSHRVMNGSPERMYSCTTNRPSLDSPSSPESIEAVSSSGEPNSWMPIPLPLRLGLTKKGPLIKRPASFSRLRPMAATVRGTRTPNPSRAAERAVLLIASSSAWRELTTLRPWLSSQCRSARA